MTRPSNVIRPSCIQIISTVNVKKLFPVAFCLLFMKMTFPVPALVKSIVSILQRTGNWWEQMVMFCFRLYMVHVISPETEQWRNVLLWPYGDVEGMRHISLVIVEEDVVFSIKEMVWGPSPGLIRDARACLQTPRSCLFLLWSGVMSSSLAAVVHAPRVFQLETDAVFRLTCSPCHIKSRSGS